ncbi:MAG TPA: tryptophan synthase subunit alpha [Chloroflexota bacterium]|nr:tryptophan synthase subunit alpha [Chloroflexota bacterium]HZU04846.1 tryptophan synthase subunit alpha [Chloroflexota bacterium]
MTRIAATFARLRARRETALFPYLTIGFPSREATAALALELVRAGADGLELGIPFSDPLADGVTLQRASQRALEAGTTIEDAFRVAQALRAAVEVPLLFMSYYNPIVHRGEERFCRAAAAAGVDGLIVPDLPLEESGALKAACTAAGLALVGMVAPTTPDERLAAIGAAAEGFVYCVSLVGVTGARAQLARDLPQFLQRVRRATALPLVVGFGVSRPEHVAAIGQHADGVIVASALADLIESAPPEEQRRVAGDYIRALKAACRRPPEGEGIGVE